MIIGQINRLAITLLALICSALGGQIDFEDLALRAGQKKAEKNEAGQTKGRPKLGHENFKLFDIK